MRKRRLFRAISLLLALILLLSGCEMPEQEKQEKQEKQETGNNGNIVEEEITERFTPDEDKLVEFKNGVPNGFWARNDQGNGQPFNCAFLANNAVIDNGLLTLKLTRENNRYAGAEYRTFGKYSYGYYSVSMKPAAESGVISSFFLYTGRPWDEIDIEFLGNDTTKVQFNYYKNGKGGHEYVFELGFDASLEFHEYGFDWQPGSITWYVDGKSVYKVTEDIPSNAAHIMMNLWNVADSHDGWAGRFDPECLPVSAEYEWIGYKSAK